MDVVAAHGLPMMAALIVVSEGTLPQAAPQDLGQWHRRCQDRRITVGAPVEVNSVGGHTEAAVGRQSAAMAIEPVTAVGLGWTAGKNESEATCETAFSTLDSGSRCRWCLKMLALQS